jgi:hypothetical protein
MIKRSGAIKFSEPMYLGLNSFRSGELLSSLCYALCIFFPSHEYIFLIDFILYSCRSG